MLRKWFERIDELFVFNKKVVFLFSNFLGYFENVTF